MGELSHTFVFVALTAVVALCLAISAYAVRLRRRAGRAHADLAASRSDLAETQRMGNMGSWRWDIRTNGLFWSEQVFRIFGLEQQTAPNFETYIQFIHPDDRERLVGTIRRAVFEGAAYQIRHRIVRPDGDVRTINAQGEVEREGGAPVRMVGICQDVTDFVRLEDEADQQRRTLRGVLDNLFVFVGMFETNGVVGDVNQACAGPRGFGRDDLIGRPLWDTAFWSYSAETQAQAREAIARAAGGEVVRGDYVVRVGEDEYITIDAIFAPLKDRNGRVVRVIGSGVDVTARKQAELAAKSSEARLRTILESEPECVKVLDANCRLKEMNTAGLRMLGVASIDDLRDRSLLEVIDARYHAAFVETVERVFGGATTQLQFEIISLDGTRRWMEQNAAPLFDPAQAGKVREMIAVTRDVSERVRMEQSSQRVRELLEQAQRIAGVGSWEWDLATGELTWSEQCHRILGWEVGGSKPTTENFLACVHRDDRKRLEDIMRAAIEAGAPCDMDHRVVWPNGEERVVHQLGEVRLDAAGRPVRMVGSTRDVTHEKAARTELLESKIKAETANQAKSSFVANMSHELRTPLNAIIGFSEILTTADEDLSVARRIEYASDIQAAGRHLLSVINDILDISRIESGKLTLDEEPVAAAELIESAYRMVRSRAEETGVVVRKRVTEHLPDILVDRRSMLQVVLNLASNAVKFSNAGGNVDLIAELGVDGGVDIIVRDTGIGMSADDIGRVGEAFLQADGRLSRKFEGTGLGLAIAKRLTELHGSRLDFKSVLGAGTTATIHLPPARGHVDLGAAAGASVTVLAMKSEKYAMSTHPQP